MSGRGGERREGRGGARGRGGSTGSWGHKERTGGWGAQQATPAQPIAPADEQPDPDTTPISCPDGFVYPPMPMKVGQCLRALRSVGEIDDRTRPILEKWEEKVRIALKMRTGVPNPPNWQVAAPRSSGWGASTDAAQTTRVADSFMISAASNKNNKKPQHPKKRTVELEQHAPPSLQSDPRLKEKIIQQNSVILQAYQKILQNQETLNEAVVGMNERLARRDDAIQKLSQYLSQLTGKEVPMLADTYMPNDAYTSSSYQHDHQKQQMWAAPQPQQLAGW